MGRIVSGIGRVIRGVGRALGRVHGTVFRALGRLPIVGGAFKFIGKLSAKGIGLLGKVAGMGFLGLGPMIGAGALGGFAEGSLQAQADRPQSASQGMGGHFNDMYSQPPMGYNQGYGNYGMDMNMGMPYGQQNYFQSPYSCGCNPYAYG